jgi:hypothetical protein
MVHRQVVPFAGCVMVCFLSVAGASGQSWTPISSTNALSTMADSVGIGNPNPIGYPLFITKAGVPIDPAVPQVISVARLGDPLANYGLIFGYDTSTAAGVITTVPPNPVAFWTYNGSAWGERMRLGNQGYLGIGTTSPTNLLDIRGAAAGTVTSVVDSWVGLRVERTANTASSAIAVQGGSKASGGVGRLYLGNADEWDSTYVEGGSGRLRVFVKNGGTPTEALTINANGDLKVQGNIEAKYQDVAEWVPAGGRLAPGTVVVLNREKRNEVMPSRSPYDTAVAGVVSAAPGVLLGEAGDDKSKIATTGRVRVRVDASAHPVRIGDLLVTSDKNGMAMVSQPVDLGGVKIHRPGTVIGKALEPLEGGEGEVLVLLSLQ